MVLPVNDRPSNEVDSTSDRRNQTRPLRVLLVSYKIRAGRGSEDGSGYHIAAELARRGCDLTLISRIDNIDLLRGDPNFADVKLVGVDVPRMLGFFKRGGRGIILYYYLWQIAVGFRAPQLDREKPFEIAHQLNFHADWAPHFLWRLPTPLVWGPIGHHRRTPQFFFPPRAMVGPIRESLRSFIKNCFWRLDPLLRLAIRRTSIILYANADLAPPFRGSKPKIRTRPYAGSFARRTDSRGTAGEDVFRVLWVGRLVPMKGLLPAIDAFARFLRNARPDRPVELVIVGEGPLKDYVPRSVSRHGIADLVRLVPWMDQENLRDLYRSASVFLYPSVEAQGLVVAEALSFGLPVVALEGTGPSLLKGPAGWSVRLAGRDGTSAALASGLADAYRLWQSGKLSDLREVATDRYESYLDWSRIVDDLCSAYEGAAAEMSAQK